MGHYIYKKFYNKIENKFEGTDEIALNPSMFIKYPLIEICQTMVHEMCHGWQCNFGNPSREAYHNHEWANKMKEVGLMPSSTGEVGGKQVGQKMSDYPIKGGRFLKVTEELINSDVFSGLYYEINPNIVSMIDNNKPLFGQIKNIEATNIEIETKPTYPVKVKYSCSCSSVWGKPNLDLFCKLCDSDMLPVKK